MLPPIQAQEQGGFVTLVKEVVVKKGPPLFVCVLAYSGGLQVRERGGGLGASGKGTELSLLCCFVAWRKSTTKSGEPKLFVCASLLPSCPPTPPCSLTYLQDPVEWTEMASRVKRATQTDGPQCGDVCPTEKEKEADKERWSQDHLSVTLGLSPLSSLSSSLAEGHHSAQSSDKDSQCAFWRKEASV